MKIDSLKTTGLAGSSRTSAKLAPKAEAVREGAGGADVRFSATSATLTAQGTEVNAARVQEIRQAIAEGRFEINPGAIADRLISTARELVGTRRQA